MKRNMNMFSKSRSTEPTTAWRMEQIAQLDAEQREHEKIAYEAAKNMGNLATTKEISIESKE